MNLVFMGTPEIALPSLQAIHQSHHKIIAVFTQPDRASGRGRKIKGSHVKNWAQKFEVPVFQPESLKGADSEQAIAERNPDCIVAVAYGLILPKKILDIPSSGCINLHFSLLPKYRGAAPVNWAIVRGEMETGVTTFFMNEKMDEGDILLQEKVQILEHERADSLSERLAHMGGPLLLETLDQIEKGQLTGSPQDHSHASYAPIIKKEDGRIDWGKTASDIYQMIRGFYPWPGAFSTIRSRTVKVLEAYPESFLSETEIDFEEGRVASLGKDSICVMCGKGEILAIKRLQPEGKKEMIAREAINGRYVQAGDRFGR
jgi:methionyl-tRNA formyltransferase